MIGGHMVGDDSGDRRSDAWKAGTAQRTARRAEVLRVVRDVLPPEIDVTVEPAELGLGEVRMRLGMSFRCGFALLDDTPDAWVAATATEARAKLIAAAVIWVNTLQRRFEAGR